MKRPIFWVSTTIVLVCTAVLIHKPNSIQEKPSSAALPSQSSRVSADTQSQKLTQDKILNTASQSGALNTTQSDMTSKKQELQIETIEDFDAASGKDFPVSPEQQLVDVWDENHSPPEPTDDNSVEWIESPFADQVHLDNVEMMCEENCADELNVVFEAVGEYADQVNSSALKALAKAEGVLLDEYDVIALKDTSELPSAPTEDGAWIDPLQ